MAVEIRHGGETVTVVSLKGTVEARSPSYTVGVTSGILLAGTMYDGAYEIVPTVDGEVVPTKSKTMRDDVTVHPIPYHATSNESGGTTVSIAS